MRAKPSFQIRHISRAKRAKAMPWQEKAFEDKTCFSHATARKNI